MIQPLNVARLANLVGRPDHRAARNLLAVYLLQAGFSVTVVNAISQVPRGLFTMEDFGPAAYLDVTLASGGTVLSVPSLVALMTEAIEPSPTKRALEIGTGSGYQTTVLAILSGHVFTIERSSDLVARSALAIAALGLQNVSFCLGDGYWGWAAAGPFDGILVTAAPSHIPQRLLEQMNPLGGRMVIPYGAPGNQHLAVLLRQGRTIYVWDLGETRFVALEPVASLPAASRNYWEFVDARRL